MSTPKSGKFQIPRQTLWKYGTLAVLLYAVSTPTFELGDGSLRTTLAMMGEGHLYPPCLAQQASVIRQGLLAFYEWYLPNIVRLCKKPEFFKNEHPQSRWQI